MTGVSKPKPNDCLIVRPYQFVIVAAGVMAGTRLDRGSWRYASIDEAFRIGRVSVIANLIFLLALFLLFRAELIPRSVVLINMFVFAALLAGPRLVYRAYRDGRMASLSLEDVDDGHTLRDEAPEDYYKRIYDEYRAAKQALGDPIDAIKFAPFAERIKGLEAEMSGKHGKPFRYRVERSGGEVVLVAVPLA